MTTRTSHRAPLRRRPFVLRTAEVTPSNRRGRRTLLEPTKGYRIRLVRVKVVQPESDGRHLCEIYFGTAGTLITEPSRAVDILAVPDKGSASTRAYPRDQGPRGRRGEPLSLALAGQPTFDGTQGDHRVHRRELTGRANGVRRRSSQPHPRH